MYLRLALLCVLATQTLCLPVREPSVWEVITNLSTVPRIVSDVIRKSTTETEVESATYSPLTTPEVQSSTASTADGISVLPSTTTQSLEESSTYSPLEDILYRITRFKRSYGCGGWGKPLPIPPPCRRS